MKNTPKTQPQSSRSVTVLPYQTGWATDFATEQTALMAALGDIVITLQHIGSTAVVGLAAKPIIDMLMIVTDLAELDACTIKMAALGYVAKGENGIGGRRYFQKGGLMRTHHLHAFVQGAPQIAAHIKFRDNLRANPQLVAQYTQLKLLLAEQFQHDTVRYQAGKDTFITQVLAQAPELPDSANGYHEHAAEFVFWREQSTIGVTTVLQWAQGLPTGCELLDLGCGSGLPLGKALSKQGFVLFGIDAAPTLLQAYQQRIPNATLALATVEGSDFFQRRFSGVLSIGLMFLLPEAAQVLLFQKVAAALLPGGQWLFSAPELACRWTDVVTGRQSMSLGATRYVQLMAQVGLQLRAQYQDEGGNHYFAAIRHGQPNA